jgi:hypothetical protein
MPAAWIAADYTFHWRAARSLLGGQDPYSVIRAVGDYPFNDTYRYPLPAAMIVTPLAWLNARLSAALFIGLSSALLAFAVTRDGYYRLLIFASVTFIYSFTGSQMAPLLMSAALLPSLGALLMAKPTIGLALFFAWPNRYAVMGGLALFAASLAIEPRWPVEWLSAATAKTGTEGNYAIPALLFAGPLLLIAILRWRRPEARLLFAMALVPQSFFFYDQFPLALIPQSKREQVLFGALTLIALLTCQRILSTQHTSLAGTTHVVATVCLYVLFLPCLAMVLRRPNVGEVPSFLEHGVRNWPGWLRGAPTARR